MIDPWRSQEVDNFLTLCKSECINVEFIEKSDLECDLYETDLLFIDTWHVYGQLKRELKRWNSSVKKYIIMHDTTVDEWQGETIRCGLNAEEQSIKYCIPLEEINKGLWPAIDEFLKEHSEWKIEHRYTNNNGLTILKRS
jgi:cephalosporin hydroxylase